MSNSSKDLEHLIELMAKLPGAWATFCAARGFAYDQKTCPVDDAFSGCFG
jgi:hypothetical protein